MNSLGLKLAAIRFAEDRSGNFAVLFGMSMMTVMMAAGFGVNLTQAYHVQSSLHAALDAAVTSTARDITTGVIKKEDARKEVEKILSANADGKFADKGAFVLDTLTIDDSAKTLEATAHAYVDPAFPLFGYDPKVAITSAALYSDKKVEIAMMLDNTWSMDPKWAWGHDKIGDLKKAATNAVKLALAQNRDPKNPRVRVALVPYADAVNIGDLADQASFFETATGPDVPPSNYVISSVKRLDNCVTERKRIDGKPDFTDDGPQEERLGLDKKWYKALVNRDNRLKRSDGQKSCPDGVLVPLTADADKLLDSIEGYKAVGVTAGAIGIQWTYYMLSHRWANAIKDASMGKGPSDYDPKKTTKVAILMTDGVFNTAFAGVPAGGERDSSVSKTKSASYAKSLCKNMKKDEIQVFTIGFDLDNVDKDGADPKEVKAMLKACASPDTKTVKHYFEASTGAELDAAFAEIIRNTERLALTK
ncbi:pilus assembly protein TadG-related protein [Mesorhizobium sp. IMUNJ 23232]|uniref:TadE/TadG family type IV pilus assembly protein n=1 Tax=Mesorhizobium sp. IMUNJ 23232 TaxID=3376064 RepID=UPI00378F419D